MAHIPKDTTFRAGDLVVAAGTNPYFDKFRQAGTVGVITEVKRGGRRPLAYTEKWGDLDYAWVLIGGEMWSMGPEDIKRLDSCKSNATGL